MYRRKFITNCAALSLIPALRPLAAWADDKMLTRQIPSSKEKLPVVGYGGARVLGSDNKARIRELMNILVERGGSVVDAHGPMETMLGQYMADRGDPSSLFVASNIGTVSEAAGSERIAQSLKALGKPSLDLLMLNRTNEPFPFWDYMTGWKAAHLVRHTGFAFSGGGFIDTAVRLIESADIDFVMASYSMFEPQLEERLLPAARDNGVATIINRPFMNGRYFERVADKPLPDWAAEIDCHSWAQFSLKWIIGNPAVTCVISETGNPTHAIDNLGAGFGRIPDEAMRKRMSDYVQSL